MAQLWEHKRIRVSEKEIGEALAKASDDGWELVSAVGIIEEIPGAGAYGACATRDYALFFKRPKSNASGR